MHIQLKSDLALAERNIWQQQETKRHALLLCLRPQQPKRGHIIARVGSWLVAWGTWMQQVSPDTA